MEIMQEGKASFYASKNKSGKISRELEIFYNPVMKFNRDVSVLLLNVLGKKRLQIADIMAGSGVRSLRFLLELNKGIVGSLVVNDHDEGFADLFSKNMKLNRIRSSKKIFVKSGDANRMLLESTGFDYIDIDPFGSPNDFLENSIVRLARKGILAVTATDTAPLSGTFPDACLRKYWAKPLRNYLMHEVGLRILIRKVQLIGAQHEKALIPIYSYFKDHYFRIFFACEKSKKACDGIIRQHAYLLYCGECMDFFVSVFNKAPCRSCSSQTNFTGPLWTGRLCDPELAERMAKGNKDRGNKRFLEAIASESSVNALGFYDVHEIAKRFKLTVPNFDSLIQAIRRKGFATSRTIFSDYGIKTDMKSREFVALMRE